MLGDARDVFEEKKVLERQYSVMYDYLQEKHTNFLLFLKLIYGV